MGKAGLECTALWSLCSCLGGSWDGIGRENSWMWGSLVLRFELASKEKEKSPKYGQEVQFE